MQAANIFLDENDHVVLGDVGLALEGSGLHDPREDGISGTPDHMAPEQYAEALYNHKIDVFGQLGGGELRSVLKAVYGDYYLLLQRRE